jgi:hypothetical protein
VGAYYDEDPNGSYAGSVYIFEKGSGWSDGHANQVAKLYPAGADSSDSFNDGVAIFGDTVVVGANGASNPNGSYAGSAYVFERGGGWSDGHANQVAKLYSADGDSSDNFGSVVAISGNTVAVGAWDEYTSSSEIGAAYVFKKGSGWSDGYASQVAKLIPDDGDIGDRFGDTVAISNGIVIVGANRDEDVARYAGSAYIFTPAAGRSVYLPLIVKN